MEKREFEEITCALLLLCFRFSLLFVTPTCTDFYTQIAHHSPKASSPSFRQLLALLHRVLHKVNAVSSSPPLPPPPPLRYFKRVG